MAFSGLLVAANLCLPVLVASPSRIRPPTMGAFRDSACLPVLLVVVYS